MGEWLKLILPGLIGAAAGVLTILVRDLLIERHKERRQERLQLLDRKLSELYAPTWVALGGGKFTLTNLLQNEEVYPKFARNFHLFSPELQRIASEYLGSVGKLDPRDGASHNLDKAAALSEEFGIQLEKEIFVLREEYLKLVNAK
jgi:hypothetical protein